MKDLIREVYDSFNPRVLHAALVGFTVVLLAFSLPR